MNILPSSFILLIVFLNQGIGSKKNVSNSISKNPMIYHDNSGECILKIFKDTFFQFGSKYFCTIEYFSHLGGGYYFATCHIDKENFVINKNENRAANSLVISHSEDKVKPNTIILSTSSKLIPYKVYYNNRMQTIKTKEFVLGASTDSVGIELFFKGCSPTKINLKASKKYMINVERNAALRQFRNSENKYLNLERGYIRNDSIFFINDMDSVIFCPNED